MRTSESINNLAAALAKAQPDIEGASKDHTNPAFRSKYADLGAVWDAIREPMARNQLALVQFPFTPCEGYAGVVSRLIHESGEWIESEFAMPVVKADPQGYGSAFTYGRRYAAMSILGVCPEDDDGQAASHRDAPQAARSARPEPQTAPADRWTAAELKMAMLEHGVKGQMFAPVFGLEPKELNAPRLMLEVAGWMTANPKKTLIDLMNLVIQSQPVEEFDELPEPSPSDLSPRSDTRMFEGVA